MAPISFARGAPAPECLDQALIADCARAALERDGITILSYGTGGGYGPLRELLAERHGVEPGRVFLTTGGLQGFVFYAAVQLALRPGRVLVEGPDLRPAAEDPGARRGRGRPARDGRRGPRSRRARGRARPGRPDLVPLHDPDLPEPVRPHDRDGAPTPARRDRRRARPADSRGRPLRPRPLRRRAAARRSTSSRAASGSRSPRRSRRRSRPVSASATSSSRRRSSRPTTTGPSRPTSPRACCPRRPCYELMRTRCVRAEPRARARPAQAAARTRCSPRSPPRCPTGRAGARPRAATSSGSTSQDDVDAAALLTRATEAGVTFVRGSDFFPSASAGRSSARLAFSYETPERIAEGVALLASLL